MQGTNGRKKREIAEVDAVEWGTMDGGSWDFGESTWFGGGILTCLEVDES